MLNLKRIGLLAAVPLVVMSQTGCFRTIEEGEHGFVVEFGKISGDLKGPGFHTYNTFTSDMKVFYTKQLIYDDHTDPLTKDQQRITINYATQYRLPPDKVMKAYKGYQGNVYDALLDPQIQESFRNIIARYKADEVIKNQEEIKNIVLADARKGLDDVVELVDIPIKTIKLPKSLEDAIEKKQVQEQESLAKQYELSKARQDAEIKVTVAKAEAEAIKIKSQALKQSPDYVELVKVEKWNGVSPKFISGNSKSSFIFPTE